MQKFPGVRRSFAASPDISEIPIRRISLHLLVGFSKRKLAAKPTSMFFWPRGIPVSAQSSSPSTRGYGSSPPLYPQLFTAQTGNNLQISDKGERAGAWVGEGKGSSDSEWACTRVSSERRQVRDHLAIPAPSPQLSRRLCVGS